MLTQSIKFYTFYCHILKGKVFERGDLSNKKKINGCSFQQVSRQNLSWFLSQHRKTLCVRGFILKQTERGKVLQKSDTIDFQNSPPFERSACFYGAITRNFEHFQYSNFETISLKKKNLFQKTGEAVFS